MPSGVPRYPILLLATRITALSPVTCQSGIRSRKEHCLAGSQDFPSVRPSCHGEWGPGPRLMQMQRTFLVFNQDLRVSMRDAQEVGQGLSRSHRGCRGGIIPWGMCRLR
jgi:hypothetical protein